MDNKLKVLVAALALACSALFQTTFAAEPVKLTVGYQSYDTISYSAAVIRALELRKKNLPPGSEVEFQNALQGSIIVNQMLANKQQIGYLGDMPAVVSTTKHEITNINLVANTGWGGIAKYAITGYSFGIPDSGYIAMREDFMKQRPDIVEAWLKTELEAQRFVLDPKNWDKVAEIVKGQTTGITIPLAWFSIYGQIPPSAGGSPIRDEKPFVFDDRIHTQLDSIYKFLHETKVINIDKAPAGALDDTVARKVAEEGRRSTTPRTIKAQDVAKAPK